MIPESLRRFLRILIPAAAVAVIIAGLWPQPSAPRTEAERVESLASNIRCPFCAGESIADAPSQIARDLEAIIAEQVADGLTDAEVYAYFRGVYGEAALMSPPLGGWGWVLWAGPLVVLVGGGYAIVRRRRSAPVAAVPAEPELERGKLRDQLDQIERDLAELDSQYADGELDEATRVDLAATYVAEAAPLRARLATLDTGDEPSSDGRRSEDVPPAGRDRRRAFTGAGLFLVAVAVVSFAVVRSADDGRGAIEVPTPPPIDFDNVTVDELENVVARNPEVVGMRLALAQLYMQQGDVQRAVFHFGEVLERERNPEALAWLGYISFQVDELDVARNYLDEALSLQPNYPQAEWWLANLLFYGFATPADAVPHLEAVLAAPDLPDEVRQEAEAMLDQAGSGS